VPWRLLSPEAISRRSRVLAYWLFTVVSHKTCPAGIRYIECGWKLCPRLKQAFPRWRHSCIILSESANCSWSFIQSTRDSYVTPLKVIGLAHIAHHKQVLCMFRDYTESNSVSCIHKTNAKYHYRCLGRTPNTLFHSALLQHSLCTSLLHTALPITPCYSSSSCFHFSSKKTITFQMPITIHSWLTSHYTIVWHHRSSQTTLEFNFIHSPYINNPQI